MKRIDGAGRSKTVTVVLSPILEDAQAIAAAALEAAEQGANVLILRNTVSACIETQLALEGLATQLGKADLCFTCAGRPAPHHARFSQEDRQALDHEIERIFGKEAQSCGRVAVATQTVQQSLDLDADLLLTDLCPMDVLLQRIGRLHRHIRPRPTGFGEPKVVVLVPAERTLHCVVTIRPDGDPAGPCGLGTVYADLRVVEATWRSLECHPSLVIPEMNRSLVEATTHPEALHDVLPALGPGGAKHVEFLEAGYYGQRQHARLNLVNRTVPFGDELCAFPDRELDRRIRSRLGEDDRLVHFEPPQPGPFDRPLSKLTVPAWFVDGIDRDDLQEVARVHEASGDQVSFTLDQKDSRLFVYDRLGLRRGETDHEDDLVDA